MWTTEEHEYLVKLTINSEKKHWQKWAKQMTDHFGKTFTHTAVRARWRQVIRGTTPNVTPAYKEEVEIMANGQVKSDKLIEMSLEQSKDQQYLLEAHGFDIHEFILTGAKSSQWTHSNKEYGSSVSYASKITVKPVADNAIDWNAIADNLMNKITPRKPIEIASSSIGYLVIPLFDLHFGNNVFADYQESLNKIHATIAKGYEKVLIISGGDLIHTDGHRGMTSSGTVVGNIDLNKAWDNAFDYIDSIINQAAKYSNEVEVTYVPGNHDENVGGTVIKALERTYKLNNRVSIDSEHKMFKATLLGHNFIGATHGDKSSRKKYPMLFATNYSQLWGKDKVVTREAFTGHLHFEQTLDMDGLLIRQAPTRNKTDQWHTDNGFNSAHKRFMLVQYNEYEPTAVYYI